MVLKDFNELPLTKQNQTQRASMPTYENTSSKERPLVLLKLGGGAVSNKRSLCEPNKEAIDTLAAAVARVWEEGTDVIVVHGAGSFGHLRCRAWQVHKGRADVDALLQFPIGGDDLGCKSQDEAVKQVRIDLLKLHKHVLLALEKHGVPCQSRPMHALPVLNTGMDFEANLQELFKGHKAPERYVDVTFGDVVNCSAPKDFGVLSGDHIMARLAMDLPQVTRAVFAVDGVQGLLRSPPVEGETQDLVSEWHPGEPLPGAHHDAAIDVTGGIGLKMVCAGEMAQHGVPTRIIYSDPNRVIAACRGEPCIGTLVCTSEEGEEKQKEKI